MADLEVGDLHDGGQQPERPGGQSAEQPPGLWPAVEPKQADARQRAEKAWMAARRGWKDHRLFAVLVVLSVVPRVLAALAFRPALLLPDSFGYMGEAVRGALGQLRPAGYPVLLRLLEPFQSLLLITTLQHVLGIGVAVIIYGMLRYWGLPGWAAALAAVPTLFDSRQIALESYILPDTIYGFMVIAAAAILLTKRIPRMWQCVLAGLLIAYASLLRGNGLLLIVPVLAYMFIRRVGWRACAAATAAFAVPVLGYMSLFYADYGRFNITNSDGFFLWARTTSFANCARVKPPPDLVPLCPDKQPIYGPAQVKVWSLSAVLDARPPPTIFGHPARGGATTRTRV